MIGINSALLPLDPLQTPRWRPPLDDKQGGGVIQLRVHDLDDVGTEPLTIRSNRGRSLENRPAGDLRLARPLSFSPLDGVYRRAMKSESRVATQICTLASLRHRPEDQLAVLEL